METNNWWEMEKWDGELIPVKPQNAEFVRQKLATGEGFINTPNRSIAVKDIKDFRETSKPFTDQKLLEGAAQAFNDPQYNEDGSIIAKWVKKPVNRRDYHKQYAAGSYRLLGEEDNYVWVAFRLPVHQIDYERVYDCTPAEVLRLEPAGGR